MSEWQVIIKRPARRYLNKLPLSEQQRILDDLTILKSNPQNVDFKPLKGRPDWRLRVGGYRVLLRVDRENKLFIVTRIGSREDIYKS